MDVPGSPKKNVYGLKSDVYGQNLPRLGKRNRHPLIHNYSRILIRVPWEGLGIPLDQTQGFLSNTAKFVF